jgi:hypothetical protein
MSELLKLTKKELVTMCNEFGLTKCKSKTKKELISLLNNRVIETDNKSQNSLNYKFIDLFCGIGGLC